MRSPIPVTQLLYYKKLDIALLLVFIILPAIVMLCINPDRAFDDPVIYIFSISGSILLSTLLNRILLPKLYRIRSRIVIELVLIFFFTIGWLVWSAVGDAHDTRADDMSFAVLILLFAYFVLPAITVAYAIITFLEFRRIRSAAGNQTTSGN